MLQTITRRWSDRPCIVAATGPSLSAEVARRCAGHHVIAVNDAYRLFPFADVLYACDAAWWDVHKGCPDFAGEKWSCHGSAGHNDKTACAKSYGLNLVRGQAGESFSLDPRMVHYGSNSGFQAINLAVLFGASPIILVGFDMRTTTKRHFFGNHPAPLSNAANYLTWVRIFRRAAERLPRHIKIINATPGSALNCFRMMDLDDALTLAARSRCTAGLAESDRPVADQAAHP